MCCEDEKCFGGVTVGGGLSGSQGPIGPAGPTGPTGPTGPAGPSGSSNMIHLGTFCQNGFLNLLTSTPLAWHNNYAGYTDAGWYVGPGDYIVMFETITSSIYGGNPLGTALIGVFPTTAIPTSVPIPWLPTDNVNMAEIGLNRPDSFSLFVTVVDSGTTLIKPFFYVETSNIVQLRYWRVTAYKIN